ncbi:protein SPT2 homolog [Sarcophilus harrisii]|uniref:protein SPT2 homolog n=1 Tax=Sarcophilus harrisii TaxID=9305 RepID=UPI001301A9C5|nr:protein SPT2 homolog [Sarcophilus harrisii]
MSECEISDRPGPPCAHCPSRGTGPVLRRRSICRKPLRLRLAWEKGFVPRKPSSALERSGLSDPGRGPGYTWLPLSSAPQGVITDSCPSSYGDGNKHEKRLSQRRGSEGKVGLPSLLTGLWDKYSVGNPEGGKEQSVSSCSIGEAAEARGKSKGAPRASAQPPTHARSLPRASAEHPRYLAGVGLARTRPPDGTASPPRAGAGSLQVPNKCSSLLRPGSPPELRKGGNGSGQPPGSRERLRAASGQPGTAPGSLRAAGNGSGQPPGSRERLRAASGQPGTAPGSLRAAGNGSGQPPGSRERLRAASGQPGTAPGSLRAAGNGSGQPPGSRERLRAASGQPGTAPGSLRAAGNGSGQPPGSRERLRAASGQPGTAPGSLRAAGNGSGQPPGSRERLRAASGQPGTAPGSLRAAGNGSGRASSAGKGCPPRPEARRAPLGSAWRRGRTGSGSPGNRGCGPRALTAHHGYSGPGGVAASDAPASEPELPENRGPPSNAWEPEEVSRCPQYRTKTRGRDCLVTGRRERLLPSWPPAAESLARKFRDKWPEKENFSP